MRLRCGECGLELPDGMANPRCPKCLLELALNDAGPSEADDELSRPAPGNQFGDYLLLNEIARGGMGVVYQARQLKLNRIVALKLILSGQFASEQEVIRFRAEAEAAANLRHPNIVAIFDIGEAKGQQYFSMEFVEGRDLAAIAAAGPLPPKRTARYCEQIARAIHYAHEHETLHRDLKPSNVLIDTNDQPRITDFGLAKRLRGDSGITATGQALGSPNFMPPEQTSGRAVGFGPAGDIYGVGAILYHLLTGRPPFQAATVEEVLRQLHENDPLPPRLLNPGIPRDLQTICLKCLAKEPLKRYRTAAELADELARYLNDRPILARPVGRFERIWRWSCRKPVLAGLLFALGWTVLLGTLGVLWQWHRAASSATALRHGLYAADINLASHLRAERDLNRAARLLLRQVPNPGEEDLRGFEWYHLSALCRGEEAASLVAHDAEVTSVAVTPNGQHFLTVGKDRSVKLWSFKTRQFKAVLKHLAVPPLNCLAVSDDGRWAAVCDGTEVTVWQCSDWTVVRTLKEPAISIAFSPGGKALATCSATGIQEWDLKSWMHRTLIDGPVERFAYSPDGRFLAIARQEVLELHDGSNGTLESQLPGKIQDHAYSLIFSPSGKFLAAGGMYGEVVVWDVVGRKVAARVTPHGSFVSGLAFSPDEQWIATGGSDQFITLGRVDGWRKESELHGHVNGIWALTFAPDSQTLLSASRDHTVKFWEIPPRPKTTLLGDAQSLVGFLPDSRTAVTLDADVTVRYWDLASLHETRRLRLQTNATASLGALTRDGLGLAIGFQDGTMQIHHLPSGELRYRGSGGTNPILGITFTLDGRLLAAISLSLRGAPTTIGQLTFWDVPTGKPQPTLTDALGQRAGAVAFSNRHHRIAVGRPDHSILIWDCERNRAVCVLHGHTWDISALTFSEDDTVLVSSSWDTSVRLWDVATGLERGRMPGLPVGAWPSCYSPDGRTLAATCTGNTIQLWQAWNQQELMSLQWSGQFVGPPAFTADGKTLGVGRILPLSPDGGVQIWRTTSP